MTLSNRDETHSHAMESCTVELTRLRMRVQELEIAADANAEHKAEQGNWGATSTPQKKLASPPQSVRVASPPAKSPTRSGTMSTSTSDSIFSPYPEDTSLPSGGAVVGNLGETFAAHMRSSQVQQQKSDELASHLIRITQLERARTALLDEVTMLSVRNAKLEDDCIGLPGLQAALVQARSQADVLLQLVGEKEEELEAAQADMREIKALYRGQLDALLEVSLAQQTQPDANV
jgi:hypothetical protein